MGWIDYSAGDMVCLHQPILRYAFYIMPVCPPPKKEDTPFHPDDEVVIIHVLDLLVYDLTHKTFSFFGFVLEPDQFHALGHKDLLGAEYADWFKEFRKGLYSPTGMGDLAVVSEEVLWDYMSAHPPHPKLGESKMDAAVWEHLPSLFHNPTVQTCSPKPKKKVAKPIKKPNGPVKIWGQKTLQQTGLKAKLKAQQADLPKALQKKKPKPKKCATFPPLKESTNADILKDLVSVQPMTSQVPALMAHLEQLAKKATEGLVFEPGVHDEVVVDGEGVKVDEPSTANTDPPSSDSPAAEILAEFAKLTEGGGNMEELTKLLLINQWLHVYGESHVYGDAPAKAVVADMLKFKAQLEQAVIGPWGISPALMGKAQTPVENALVKQQAEAMEKEINEALLEKSGVKKITTQEELEEEFGEPVKPPFIKPDVLVKEIDPIMLSGMVAGTEKPWYAPAGTEKGSWQYPELKHTKLTPKGLETLKRFGGKLADAG